jgi:hypothetical protein
VPAISSLLIIGGGIAVASFAARSEKRRRRAILTYIAKTRHGSLDAGGWFGNPRLQLSQRDGFDLTISMWSTKHGAYTEYNATLLSPGLPECRVTPTGFTGEVAKALGAQDIEIGHGAFDDVFTVKADDAPAVKRMWSRSRARELALLHPKSRLECDGARLKLLQPVIDDVEQVETGIALILELAQSDPFGMKILGELPEAQLARDVRGFVRAQVPGPSPILVGPVARGKVVRTCVRTAAIGTLPPDAEALVAPTGGALEQTATELQIWWPAIETDRRRLLAAVDAVRRLSVGPAQGVFR